jgi:hypothetical protein
MISLNSRLHDCICSLLLKTATVKAYKSAGPVSLRQFSADLVLARLPFLSSLLAKSAGKVCRQSLPVKSDGQVCRPSLLAKSAGQVCWPSLPAMFSGQVCRPSLIKSNGCSSQTVISNHVWSCLIMFDQLSAEILASLIKGSMPTRPQQQQSKM